MMPQRPPRCAALTLSCTVAPIAACLGDAASAGRSSGKKIHARTHSNLRRRISRQPDHRRAAAAAAAAVAGRLRRQPAEASAHFRPGGGRTRASRVRDRAGERALPGHLRPAFAGAVPGARAAAAGRAAAALLRHRPLQPRQLHRDDQRAGAESGDPDGLRLLQRVQAQRARAGRARPSAGHRLHLSARRQDAGRPARCRGAVHYFFILKIL